MDEWLLYKTGIVLAVFIFLFVIERLRPSVASSAHQFKRVAKNLLFWPLNIGLSFLVIIPISLFAATHALWGRADMAWWGIIFDIMVLDLFIFLWHRAVHEAPFLWRFHEVHHLDEHLDTTSAIRFHFGEVFFSALARAVVIIVLAIPISSVLVFEMFVLVFTLFHHSNIALPTKLERRLSYVVVTPSIHWVHHHALRRDTDSNYGTIFSFWDRLFKTKSETIRFETMKIGVVGRRDRGFLELLLSPFIKKG